MNKRKIIFILRILVSLTLLFLLFWLARENFSKIWQLLNSVNGLIFILAFLMYIASIIVMTWRFRIVLFVQKASFNFRDLLSLTFIGHFFTNLMPSAVGGDLVKGYIVSKKINSKIASYSAILVDRIIGMFSLTLIASIATIIVRKDIEEKFIFWIIFLFLMTCIIFVLLLFNKKLLKKIGKYLGLTRLSQLLRLNRIVKVVNRLYEAINIYKSYKKVILQAFLISIIAQFIAFFAVYILSGSLSSYIPFGKIILVMPIIYVLCMLPITINGLGLREWAFIFFFSSNIGNAAALSLSLLYLAMFLFSSLVGGIVYLFWR